jgi:hypothetical protein
MDEIVFHKGFIRYPKIKTLGDRDNEGILITPGRVVVQEKVDGANFGFYVKDGIIYFCSHGQNLKNSVQIDETGMPNKWPGIEPVLTAFNADPDIFDENLYVYAESMQRHRMAYDDIPGFLGYDVMCIDSGEFLHWSAAKTYVNGLGLPFINVIRELDVPLSGGIDYLETLYRDSVYREGSAEGIVIKRYDTQQFAKIVDDAFKEKVERPRTFKDSHTECAIADTYATPARIEKVIYELRDEGNELEMPLMRKVFTNVVDDILCEEGEEIGMMYGVFDTKTLGSVVSRKCAPVLKNMIMDQAIV